MSMLAVGRAVHSGSARRLEAWFRRNARDLPWRQDPSPYHVLLTEFLLQQTRVETGLRYWPRFVNAFPTLEALAAASEEEVLRLWSGLGYYARARNLHATARRIVAAHGGRVPDDPKVLETLPGIGPYTAGAIASIAYDRPAPALDGNQLRVIGRILGLRRPEGARARRRIEGWARALLMHGSPGALNQALMDLGSEVCTPRNPGCGACPLRSDCRGRTSLTEVVRDPPARARVEHWDAHLHVAQGRLWLQAPTGTGLLGRQWLPPLTPTPRGRSGPRLEHAFSHKTWRVRLVRKRSAPQAPGRWVAPAELERFPHSSLTRKLIQAAFGSVAQAPS